MNGQEDPAHILVVDDDTRLRFAIGQGRWVRQ